MQIAGNQIVRLTDANHRVDTPSNIFVPHLALFFPFQIFFGGDRLWVEVTQDGRVLLEPATVDVLELKGMLPRPAKPLGLADMERVIRERAGK